ncbi:MAG: alpha-glucosidase C-terminal domain-containing protein [Anaerolineaceae bacterium]|nr:alpha-glucosidase C-terminal domain-containing protein [Anaerolineaceae bacterium]
MKNWAEESIFYHIYPLGLTGAPERNDFHNEPVPRLEQLFGWLDHIQWLGANAIYLGPVFESTAHGYDTVDYFHVDRRLGTDETLAAFADEVHRRGMRLVLDGVFNHVGRNFWAFHDVREHGEQSPYCDWFHNLHFGEQSPRGDPFTYEGWAGYDDLVKLNLHNPAVVEHLLQAVTVWIERYQIDGLRLDAADAVNMDFLRTLAAHCRQQRPDFWLMGEIVFGDYRQWANPETLDSVTNYECYKALYSSHNDHNYFELAYALNRQFGERGIYRDLALYNFVDNHDVNRLASTLQESAHLYPLHILLFSIPGMPSIYYGSEWGQPGQRSEFSDADLRPALKAEEISQQPPQSGLAPVIHHLSALWRGSQALQHGTYREVQVQHEQLAFLRQTPDETLLVMVNSADQPAGIRCTLSGRWEDILNPGNAFEAEGGTLQIEIPAWWGRVLRKAK